MRLSNDEPHPWLLEDVGLRFAAAAAEMERAVAIFDSRFVDAGDAASAELLMQRSEAIGFITRTTAYACHARETNLARLLRGGVRTPLKVCFEERVDVLIEQR